MPLPVFRKIIFLLAGLALLIAVPSYVVSLILSLNAVTSFILVIACIFATLVLGSSVLLYSIIRAYTLPEGQARKVVHSLSLFYEIPPLFQVLWFILGVNAFVCAGIVFFRQHLAGPVEDNGVYTLQAHGAIYKQLSLEEYEQARTNESRMASSISMVMVVGFLGIVFATDKSIADLQSQNEDD